MAGTVISAVSPNFIFLIVAGAISAMGMGAIMPLVFLWLFLCVDKISLAFNRYNSSFRFFPA
jgi:predicted MFS family arabinose efflux permease